MVSLELMNKWEGDMKQVSQGGIAEIQKTFTEIDAIRSHLLTQEDIYVVKDKTYINRKGYRKLAVAFSISTQVISESRIESWDTIIYNFTVRATTALGRYVEASASCSSSERDFNNLEHDVRAVSQTRASNRAIGELIWLSHLPKSNSGDIVPQEKQEGSQEDIWGDAITVKQKRLLIKLIESKYQDESMRNDEYQKIHSMTKSEARIIIRDLIEEGVEY